MNRPLDPTQTESPFIVKPSFLQRFTQVRSGERWPLLCAAIFFFCVLTALMVLRPAREALGMQRGIEAIRWLFFGTVLVTLAVNPLFGWLVSRLRRMVFVSVTYLFFALGLLGFYALLVFAPAGVGAVSGQVFYVWFSVFNLFATMLFWALMTDRFSREQSQRLFGAIAVGGTLGAIFGPWLASQLARPLGTASLLPIAAGFLIAGLGAAFVLMRLQSDRIAADGADAGGEAIANDDREVIGGSAWEGLKAVFASRFLLGICAYVLILAVISTFLYFTRLQMVAALGSNLDLRTTVFAQIDLITQITTLVLQAVVAGHLMKRLGLALTLALLPITSLLGFIGLALVGSLAVLIAFEAIFKAVQRGIMRPARETLFTYVSRSDRYKAKAFIDTFVYRTGDVVGAQLEGALGKLGMGLAALISVALPITVAWIALGWWLGRRQQDREPLGRHADGNSHQGAER